MPRLLLAAVLMLAAGCGSDEPATFDALNDAAIRVVDYPALKALVAQQKGRRVVLGGWTMGRGGEAFYRGLASLAAGDKAPAVIALSFDGPAAVQKTVLPLIREHGQALINAAFHDDQMMLLGLVDPDWTGQLPALWLFDAEGKRTASFYGDEALAKAKAP